MSHLRGIGGTVNAKQRESNHRIADSMQYTLDVLRNKEPFCGNMLHIDDETLSRLCAELRAFLNIVEVSYSQVPRSPFRKRGEPLRTDSPVLARGVEVLLHQPSALTESLDTV